MAGSLIAVTAWPPCPPPILLDATWVVPTCSTHPFGSKSPTNHFYLWIGVVESLRQEHWGSSPVKANLPLKLHKAGPMRQVSVPFGLLLRSLLDDADFH